MLFSSLLKKSFCLSSREAKDRTPKENKRLSDSSSPSVPQNDIWADFFNSLLVNTGWSERG